jgi:hypothetical protein
MNQWNLKTTPRIGKEMDRMVSLLATVLEPQSAFYLSAPITSGKRHLAGRAGKRVQAGGNLAGGGAVRKEQVVNDNLDAAKLLGANLRKQLSGELLIEPAELPFFEDWSQADYYCLWAQVISRFTKGVIMSHDWEYSNGCVFEFRVAIQTQITTLDDALQPLSVTYGIDAIARAVQEVERQGSTATFLRSELRELCELTVSVDGTKI